MNERRAKNGNELALTPSSNDRASSFFIKERVNLADPVGLANSLLPLPREEVIVDFAT